MDAEIKVQPSRHQKSHHKKEKTRKDGHRNLLSDLDGDAVAEGQDVPKTSSGLPR